MEFIKSFLKLPESERQKVHEAILLLENAGSPNEEPDNSINCSKDLLGLLKRSPVKPASNQKTLDSWIVKKKPLPTVNPQKEKPQCSDEDQTLDADKSADKEVHTDNASDLQSNSAGSSTISNFKEYSGEHLMSKVNKRELKVLIKRQDCLETSKYENNSSVSSCTELLCDVSDNVSSNNCPVSKVNKDTDIMESSKLGNMSEKQKTDSDSPLPERSYNLRRSARIVSNDTNKAQIKTLNSPSKSNELSVLNNNSECDDVNEISDVPVKSAPKIKSSSKNVLGKKAHIETEEIKSTMGLNACTADIDSKTDSAIGENIVKNSSGTVKKKMKKTVVSGICTKKANILNCGTSESIPKQDLKKTDSCLKVSGKLEDLYQPDEIRSDNDMESVNSSCSIECDSEKNLNANSIKNTLVQYAKNKVLKKNCRKIPDTNKSKTPVNSNNESSTSDNEASSQIDSVSTIEVPIAKKKDRDHVSVNTILKLKTSKKKSSGKKVCFAKKNKLSLSLRHSPRKKKGDDIKESKEDKDILSHSEMKKGQKHLEISSADIDSNFVGEKKNIPDEQITVLGEGSSTIPGKKNVKSSSEKIKKKNDPENLVFSLEVPTSHIEAHCNDVKTLTTEEVMPSSEQNCENILQEILNDDSDSSLIEENLELLNISSQKESLKRKNSTALNSTSKIKPPKRKKLDTTFENNSASMKVESLRSAKNTNGKNRNSGIKAVPSIAKSVIECNEEKSVNSKSCSRRTNRNKLTDLVIPNVVSQPNSNEAVSNIENKSKNSNLSTPSKDHKKINLKKSSVTILKNNQGEGNTSNNSVLERKKDSDALEKVEINNGNTSKCIKTPLIESNCTKEKTPETEQTNSKQKSVELDDEMNRNYAAFCKMSKVLESLEIDIKELFLNQKMKNSLKSIQEDGIFIIKKYNLDVKNSENIYMHESKEELKKILQNLSDK
ncbi:hypothetical protein TNIN_121 [Trichonephila inaurata madagascariensis]|uniref:Uncharacterized protein n=1 Tax=Trichonephila inaurata madagascariensis TaxID=2747483 RepID=A0A8X6IP71_9ARAC|nr:hypothetical protein TNIN_121 [Trichonephila inaurata madagascariensis]